MIRATLFVAFGLLLGHSAVAEDAGAGRYQIAPDGDGFVRLDTETGALAHCDRSDGVWRCAVVAEDRSAVDRRIVELQEELAALRGDLTALSERLAALEEGEEEAPATSDNLAESEKEFDEALSFAERMMRRFFDMVRELKNEEPPQQI